LAKRTDVTLGAIFLALSGVVYFLARDIPSGSLEEGMGSAFFPRSLAAVMAGFSLAFIGGGIFGRKGAASPGERPAEGEKPRPLIGPHLRLPAALTLVTALYLSLVEALGFLLATPLFVLAVMRLFRSGWARAALAGVSVTAGLYVVFQLGLRIPFPAGLLGS